jgi:hypothetical protein
MLVALALVLLVACSGKSGTGQFINAPTAVATPIGYKPTSATGANPVTMTVRAGADVQLTGEDSDDGNISISGFTWQQTDTAPIPAVQLIYRNASTISFTAPSVAQDTTLHFQLTVTNALGLTGTNAVQVLVKAANDPNRFLALLATPHSFRVALALTTANASPGDPIPLAADAPVCVKLAPSISYLNRSAAVNIVPLPVQTVDAKWLQSVGATAGFPASAPAYQAFRNPVVSFDLPVLNDDLLFAKYNQPGATAADTANQLVSSDIDSAYVQMLVSAMPGSCDGNEPGAALNGTLLMVQLEDEAGTPVGPAATASAPNGSVTVSSSVLPQPNPLTPDGSANLTADDFLRVAATGSNVESPNTSLETRESATAYFAAIDPSGAKTTLTGWLTNNCFDANSATYGAGETGYNVVHATYTNNFDLSFGRDMYFSTCANGNMAAVVINYPTLEAAANQLGAFLAVAMEYTPPAGSSAVCFTNPANPATNTGKCATKFFAFAPDDRTGSFVRVLSANFDRRGQKYLPGACTVCHGGKPGFTSGQPYPNAANIDAAFMPWDMGSLLFADTDPAFACSVSATAPACASINPSLYTQAAQAPNIQQLNALAWRTYQSPELVQVTQTPPTSVNRFQAAIDLLTKWYGGDPAAATAHAFDDSTTPADWQITGQSAPADLYHTVFARYCRSCHTQNSNPSEQFANYANFASFLVTANTSVLPVSSTNIQQLVFHNNQMPLSRLTADRFWVDYNNGQSAAQTLATYINSVAAAAPTGQNVASIPVDANMNVVPPGQPQIALLASAPAAGTQLQTAGPNVITRFQGASVDALTQSVFAATYQWSLCSGGKPAVPGGACSGTSAGLIGTPIAPAGSSAGAPQSGASLPAFATVTPGTYYLTLSAQSASIGATPASTTYQIVVPQHDPALTAAAQSGNCPSTLANFNGAPITIDVSATCFTALGDAGYTGYRLQVSGDGVTYSNCINTANCSNLNSALPWTASVFNGNTTNATGQNVFIPTIIFSFTPSATGSAELYYQWCDFDNVCVAGNAAVALSHLAALAATIAGYWDPSANSTQNTSAQNAASLFFGNLPSGAQLKISRPPYSTPGSDLLNLGAYLIMDPATDAYTFTLMPPSDGGTLNGSGTALTVSGFPTQVLGQASSVTYTPGADTCVNLDVNGQPINNTTNTSCTNNSGVTLNYTLMDTTQTTSSVATGTINIQALTSFYQSASIAPVYGIVNNASAPYGCAQSTCHSASANNIWAVGSTAQSTYSSIMGATSLAGHPLVIPGDPLHSAFYTAPCTLLDPFGGAVNMLTGTTPPLAPLTSPGCLTIYQWILEGAQLD